MAARKGHRKLGGRVKGTPNKITKTVREAFLYAFNELQKDPKKNLVTWGKRSPNAFYMLAAKLIPVELKAQVTTLPGADMSNYTEEQLKAYEEIFSKQVDNNE